MYWQTYALFPVHKAPSESMFLCGLFWMSLALPSSTLVGLPLRWSPSTMCPNRRHTVLSGHWGMLLMKVLHQYMSKLVDMHTHACEYMHRHTRTCTHTWAHTLLYTPPPLHTHAQVDTYTHLRAPHPCLASTCSLPACSWSNGRLCCQPQGGTDEIDSLVAMESELSPSGQPTVEWNGWLFTLQDKSECFWYKHICGKAVMNTQFWWNVNCMLSLWE